MTAVLPDPFLLGPWRVLRGQNRLERDEPAEVERLENKAMDVLCVLAARAGQTVSREDLLEAVWPGRIVVEETLSRVIAQLRAALGDDARSPTYIETVPKRGYRLRVMPQPLPLPAAAPAPSPAPPPAPRSFLLRQWIGRTLAVLLLGAVAWHWGWPALRLELAVRKGLAAIAQRESGPTDDGNLREQLRRIRPARVLWVDDKPSNNEMEIATLNRAGVEVDTTLSNAEAAEQVRGREYDLVISDIYRTEHGNIRAGFDLPRALMPDRNRLPPLIYYTGKVEQPRSPDGYPVTDRPSELFREISQILRGLN